MHEYDVALKNILTRPGSALLTALTGSPSLRWLNVEAPLVRNLRVDLLGETPDRKLIHMELQSRNTRDFPLRMAEYSVAVARKYHRIPSQIAVYVGNDPLRMKNRIATPDWSYRFHLLDIRDVDGDRLIASDNLSDNIVALLTRWGARSDAVRQILKRIADGPSAMRDQAITELSIVAGLRKLTSTVKQEANKMPILNDIMDDEVFGPLIRQGRAEGQMEILVGLLEKRFGAIPPRIQKRLASLKPDEIKAAGLRLLDAARIEDLFAR